MAAPFLKWAGGKAKLVPAIAEHMPATFGRYHEPFLGGGAVFFALGARIPLEAPSLNDANQELVEAFTVVRDDAEPLVARLQAMAAEYLPLGGEERAALFYRVRAASPESALERAARFIFLNRTCYNGLYRVNREGRFNVPHGRYATPAIVNADNMRAVAAMLATAALRGEDFEAACERARPGDFVYFDPPYHPLSRTSRFTAYTKSEFGWQDQMRLAALFARLTSRGVYALLSNSAHPEIAALYPGFEHQRVPMSRSINSKPGLRSPIDELLVSNVAEVTRRHA